MSAQKPSRRDFGSVRKFPSGRWQARYKVEGATHYGPMTYETKSDAQTYLATVHADLVRETWRAPRLVTEPVGVTMSHAGSMSMRRSKPRRARSINHNSGTTSWGHQ